MDKLLMTPEEAAECLGVGRTKVYELMSTGQIKSVRIGRCRRIATAEVADLVARLRQEAEA